MSQYSGNADGKLRRHIQAIKEHPLEVALMLLYLEGYEVELNDTGSPRASAAKEILDELSYEGIPIWSCSTTSGGIWETWQRDALKYGDLDATNSYAVWERRPLHCKATTL